MTVNLVDDQTLEHLIRRHQHDVWRYLRYLGAESHAADDLTQETFLSVIGSVIGSGFEQRGQNETSAYLRNAARFAWLNWLKRERRNKSVLDIDAADEVWVEFYEMDARQYYLDALGRCMETLEERDRLAVHMKYGDDQTIEAVAGVLAMTPDSAKTYFARVRKKLRECIEAKLDQ